MSGVAAAAIHGMDRLARMVGPAPADRPEGRRGRRAPLALLASLAALAALIARTEESGSGGSGARMITYRLDGPVWVDPALLVVALLLGMLAMALWAARRPVAVSLALLLIPCALCGGIVAFEYKHRSGRISRDDVRAAARQTTESGVRGLLGPPAGHGTARTPSGRAECLVYVGDAPDRTRLPPQHTFCFRDGQLLFEESW